MHFLNMDFLVNPNIIFKLILGNKLYCQSLFNQIAFEK